MLESFFQALRNLRSRGIFPTLKDSTQIQQLAPAVRQSSFFSATVDKARVLTGYKRALTDWLEGAVEEVDGPYGKQIAYKTGNASSFIDQAREFAVKEGFATPADFGNNQIQNPVGNERLKLVFNTNIQQAQELAIWQMRVQNETWLNLYPAARFMRSPGATEPRPRHVQAEGEVRRWDDFDFWLYQNAADIGGFEVPWGPFGFNSYMYQEPVKRKEAERLGLVRPGERIRVIDATKFGAAPADKLLTNSKASVREIPEEIKGQLKRELVERFGPGIVTKDGKLSLDAVRKLRDSIGK